MSLTQFTDMIADWADWIIQIMEGVARRPQPGQPDWEWMEHLARRGRIPGDDSSGVAT